MMFSTEEKMERASAVALLQNCSSYMTDEEVETLKHIHEQCMNRYKEFCKKGIVGQLCLKNTQN